jgi:hypothetical protein
MVLVFEVAQIFFKRLAQQNKTVGSILTMASSSTLNFFFFSEIFAEECLNNMNLQGLRS